MTSAHLELARRVAALFAPLPEVEAVALGGSRGGAGVDIDASSDIDDYVYTRGDIPLAVREEVVEAAGGATRADLGMSFWGPGDEWLHAPTRIHVDVIYFDAAWREEPVERVLALGVPFGAPANSLDGFTQARIEADGEGGFTLRTGTGLEVVRIDGA